MKYTCNILVTDSIDADPKSSAEYEYFVRAKDIDACHDLIRADLQQCDPGRERILSIGIEENDSPYVPFPDGEGIVHRRGPIEMTKVQNIGLQQKIKNWIGSSGGK